MASDMGALRDQTAVHIREWGGGRKQRAVKSSDQAEGHLRTMGVAVSLYLVRPLLVRPLLGGIACAGYEADRLSGKAEERWEREGAKLAAAMLEVIDLRYDHGIRADVCSRPTQDIGSYPLVSGPGTLNASRTPSAHRLDHLILAGQLVGRSVSPDGR